MIVVSVNTAARLIKIDTRFATFNEWKESEHQRDKDGKFAPTGENSGKSEKPVASLSKEEYGQIMHELNTNLTKEEINDGCAIRHIGNRKYYIGINEFNDYEIYDLGEIK